MSDHRHPGIITTPQSSRCWPDGHCQRDDPSDRAAAPGRGPFRSGNPQEGEWLDAVCESSSADAGVKLRIGINADTHDVVVAELTPDAMSATHPTVTGLLEQVDGKELRH